MIRGYFLSPSFLSEAPWRSEDKGRERPLGGGGKETRAKKWGLFPPPSLAERESCDHRRGGAETQQWDTHYHPTHPKKKTDTADTLRALFLLT